MKRVIIFLFLYLLAIPYSKAQNSLNQDIHIQVACGWIGMTSASITSIKHSVNTKAYTALKQKLFSQDRSEAFIGSIAIKELLSKKLITLTPAESVQLKQIAKWTVSYSLCYTCTERFEGTVNELLTKENNPAYEIIRSAIFRSN